MSTTPTDPEAIRTAAHAVVEYATVAFQIEFLRWDKTVNLGVAEMVWNAHSAGVDPHVDPQTEPELIALFERLGQVRRLRWGEERFLVFGLDVRYEDDDILFTFDLTWDDGRTFQPCEIAWDIPVAEPDGQRSVPLGSPFPNLS